MLERRPHLASIKFERVAGGFVYYASAWSKGVPVSAAAREAYIFGSRGEGFEAILGREATAPRRPYWRTMKRMLIATLYGHDPAEPEI